MRNLVLFLNEFSVGDLYAGGFDERLFVDSIKKFSRALDLVFGLRRDARVFMSKAERSRLIRGRPLISWFERALGRDAFVRFQGRIIKPVEPAWKEYQLETLGFQVYYHALATTGLTHAFSAESFVFGSDVAGGDFTLPNFPVSVYWLERDIHEDSLVRSISSGQSFELFKEMVEHFGTVPSENCTLKDLGDLIVLMYPYDHGYPHVHVVERANPELEIKYRIDVFEPLTRQNPWGLDERMQRWISENRETLSMSWSRCLMGQRPLRVV